MIGDVVIIFLAIASGWSAYKLFTMEIKYSTMAFCLGLVLLSFLIGGIIAPNRDLLTGIFSPEINGTLIDSETNKPVSDVDIIVDWGSSYGEFPMHSGYSHLKSIRVKSDAYGKFYAPSRHRSLAIMLFPLYNRENSDSRISIFSLDYDVIDSKKSDKSSTLILKRITDYDRLSKKFQDLEWSERYGSKTEKALATAYKNNFDQKRREFINRYGMPKNVLDRVYGR